MMRQARIKDGKVDYYSEDIAGKELHKIMDVVKSVLGNKKLIALIQRVYPFLPRTWQITVDAQPRNPTEDMEATEGVSFEDMDDPGGGFVTFSFEYHYDKRPVLLETAYGPGEGPPEFWKTADPILKEAKKLGIEVDDEFYTESRG